MAKVLDCGHKVSKFKFYLCYYIHFWISTLGKSIPPAMGEIISLLFFYKDGFGIK